MDATSATIPPHRPRSQEPSDDQRSPHTDTHPRLPARGDTRRPARLRADPPGPAADRAADRRDVHRSAARRAVARRRQRRLQVILADGTALGDIRYALRTDDGELLYVQSRRIRHGSADVLGRLGRGEPVDPSEYTFRAATQIETTAPRLDWLNKGVSSASPAASLPASSTRSTSSPEYPVSSAERATTTPWLRVVVGVSEDIQFALCLHERQPVGPDASRGCSRWSRAAAAWEARRRR
jgi:hypothetical protein